ncbi:MAG: PHP domain-containing protein, partial [Planctomycetota bacterium]
EAWSYDWQHDDAMVQRAVEAGRQRMVEYRRMVDPLRGPAVRLGLEVDLRRDGSLLLHPDDRAGWDVLVGALHRIPAWGEGELNQQRAEELFMTETEKMLATGVDVLAHPFRIFRRSGMERPPHLYEPLAELLARYGVAAEINYHTNDPDPAFVSACVERGVKIALGSDSHDLAEVGEFWPHLDCLARAGVAPGKLPEVLLG